ncbi:oxidoreductase [Apiospora rasikravindrae]|uniref:Oxidoreductase n=1 Tax=Apiospora rasikravindrae TaxID=990691 RepID=A0ABR1TE16_9PEZI
MAPVEVLIVGCGIAGPTLATFLLLIGDVPAVQKSRITVLERASERVAHARGQNIDVRGAGVTVLRKLGIENLVRRSTTGEVGVRLVDERDRLDQGDGDKVHVRFAKSGARRSFDLVVGADGLHSRTRKMVWGEEGEKDRVKRLGMYAGFFSIPREEKTDDQWRRWFHAPGRRGVMLRPDGTGKRTTVLMSVVKEDEGENRKLAELAAKGHAGVSAQKALLEGHFRDAEWECERILREMETTEDFYFDMVAQVKMDRWSKGRVVLLGDAGYCASPISGLGTTLAFTAAYNLAGCLQDYIKGATPDPSSGLAEYEAKMRPIVEEAQRLAPGQAYLMHPETAWGILTLHLQEGVIIGHAKNTITPEGGIAPQPKLDRTGYTYTTRSYGVGSSVGLVDSFQPTPKGYRYSEMGVHATVECLYNYSSQYNLQREDKPAHWSLNVYTTNGSFPNHGTSVYAATALDDKEACVMGTTSEPATEEGTYYAVFATLPNSTYDFLDKLQCQIFYDTTVFDLAVNVTNQTIEVRPSHTLAGWEGRVPLARAATRRLNMMGQVFGATQWKSLLCDTFLTNVATFQSIHGGGGTSRNDSTPYGASFALESMVDSVLGALSAAQLVVSSESYNVTAGLDSPAYRLGTRAYVLANFVLNGIVALIVLVEIVRTRLWREAPDFNPMDVENVISASLAGRSQGARLFRQRRTGGQTREVRMHLVGGVDSKQGHELNRGANYKIAVNPETRDTRHGYFI